MAEATKHVISYAIFVAISPIPLIAVVAMLAGPNGRANGVAFLFGWLAGLLVAGVGAGAAHRRTVRRADRRHLQPVRLGAARARRGDDLARRSSTCANGPKPARPQSRRAGSAPWTASTRYAQPGLAVALAIANPKNLILLAGAATAAAETGASTESKLEAMLVFAMVALIGPAIPVGATRVRRRSR